MTDAAVAPPDDPVKLRETLKAAVLLAEKQAEARRLMADLHLALARRIVRAESGGHLSVHDASVTVNRILGEMGSHVRASLAYEISR